MSAPVPLRVVLADDTDDLRSLLKLALERDGGFEVVGEARNGEEAIGAVEAHRPDLLLLDLAMPVMDGLEALPAVRERAPGTTVVVLSGFDSDAMAEQAMAAGAAAYLQKGLPVRQLTERLRATMAVTVPPPRTAASTSAVLAGDVLAVTAHELRSPLTGVLGAAAALASTDAPLDEPTRVHLAGIVVRQGRRLSRLVDDLLAAARLDAGQLHARAEHVDVAATVDEALEALSLDPDGTEVRVRCDDGLVAVGDRDRIVQVVVNLLANGHRHGEPPFHLDARSTGPFVEIAVRDHGGGVPHDAVPKLFRRWQSGAVTTGGLGLGLYLVDGLVRAMGGDVRYEPADPGARFTVRLPAP